MKALEKSMMDKLVAKEEVKPVPAPTPLDTKAMKHKSSSRKQKQILIKLLKTKQQR